MWTSRPGVVPDPAFGNVQHVGDSLRVEQLRAEAAKLINRLILIRFVHSFLLDRQPDFQTHWSSALRWWAPVLHPSTGGFRRPANIDPMLQTTQVWLQHSGLAGHSVRER